MDASDRLLPFIQTPLGRLPEEKIVAVLSQTGPWLTYRDVIHITRVCKDLKRIGNDEILWHGILRHYFGDVDQKRSWQHTFRRSLLAFLEKVDLRLSQVRESFCFVPIERAFYGTWMCKNLPDSDRKVVCLWQNRGGKFEVRWFPYAKVEAHLKEKGTAFKNETRLLPHFMRSGTSADPSEKIEMLNTQNSLGHDPEAEKRYFELFDDLN